MVRAEANTKVQQALEEPIEGGRELGMQVAAYLDGEPVIDAWAGLADEATARPVAGDTLFTSFSISKGITSTCIHILAERGKLGYDDPIAKYWPEFATKGKSKATVRDALVHRVGIPQDPPGFDVKMAADWDGVCAAVADLEPLWEPGTKTGYHALTFGWILAEVLRRVDGRTIAQFLQDEVCRPLGAEGMYFGVPSPVERRVATLKNAPGLGQIPTTLTPSLSDPARAFNRPEVRRLCVPGAGALVNARSLARLYAMLADGGEIDGVRLLSRDRVAVAATPEYEGVDPILSVILPVKVRWSLGYMLGGGPGPMAGRPNAFGYMGIGTIGFADPSRHFAFAFLKNLIDWSPRMNESATLITKTVEQSLGIA